MTTQQTEEAKAAVAGAQGGLVSVHRTRKEAVKAAPARTRRSRATQKPKAVPATDAAREKEAQILNGVLREDTKPVPKPGTRASKAGAAKEAERVTRGRKPAAKAAPKAGQKPAPKPKAKAEPKTKADSNGKLERKQMVGKLVVDTVTAELLKLVPDLTEVERERVSYWIRFCPTPRDEKGVKYWPDGWPRPTTIGWET